MLLERRFIYQMQPGTFELLILVFIFLGLQAWWIIPIIKKIINLIREVMT